MHFIKEPDQRNHLFQIGLAAFGLRFRLSAVKQIARVRLIGIVHESGTRIGNR